MEIKKSLLVLSLVSLFSVTNVFALKDDSCATIANSNGVRVTEKEYNFIKQYYGDRYFKDMTEDDYKWLEELDINNSQIEIVEINDYTVPTSRGASYSTPSKNLKVAKQCVSSCIIYINADWLINPFNRSYDVIGARYENVSLVNDLVETKVTSSLGTEKFSTVKRYDNGHGTSVKLPENATDIRVEQKFRVSSGGRIFASYQHSNKNITSVTSSLYTISSSGYGSVFSFYGSAINVFDKMAGVNIGV